MYGPVSWGAGAETITGAGVTGALEALVAGRAAAVANAVTKATVWMDRIFMYPPTYKRDRKKETGAPKKGVINSTAFC